MPGADGGWDDHGAAVVDARGSGRVSAAAAASAREETEMRTTTASAGAIRRAARWASTSRRAIDAGRSSGARSSWAARSRTARATRRPDSTRRWPRRSARPVGGVTAPRTLVASALLGVWLMFTRLAFGTEPPLADSDHLVGALIVAVAVAAMAEVARAALHQRRVRRVAHRCAVGHGRRHFDGVVRCGDRWRRGHRTELAARPAQRGALRELGSVRGVIRDAPGCAQRKRRTPEATPARR